MGERKIKLVPGEFYHIYNRGNSKQIIFKDDFDYQRFQILLFLANSTKYFKVDYLRKEKIDFFEADRGEQLVAIGAYCLVPNHYHVLITPLVEDGVSLFMKKLGTGYSMFFNKRYDRTGSLFEGRYKSQWADSDEYLKYLYSYIHLNPMKLHNANWKDTVPDDKAVSFIENYSFSSYWDVCNQKGRREQKILNNKVFPQFFSKHEEVSHIYDWFSNRTDLLLNEV